MLEQLRKIFPKIDKEIILKAWEQCADVDKTNALLTWLTENTYMFFNKVLLCIFLYSTNLQQQHHLMMLFRDFGNKFEKIIISQTWKNNNQVCVDTAMELREICAISNLNKSQEKNEIKISREMCLHILWNILKYPKYIKYRKIHKQALYNNLFSKCHHVCANLKQILVNVQNELEKFGFKKGNDDNWYYQYDHIQLLHLWNCYRSLINQQTMFFIYIKQDIGLKTKCVYYGMENGKIMKVYLIMDIEQ
ncbi:hypothetical protein RFI_34044 [Reticulomyxa filosa]|uniref:CUE domain-containing protein n=1 Tax=Reticulomyxa filosa TaxID=46433 RepID=X6LQH4_RETFI|nr:hypothetical protein RFI_34044 [Reticulomyxa filosa]|eukprot:ETO03367.1 hypothetical protein RFI_34044 [Reticulomyxa filosa]